MTSRDELDREVWTFAEELRDWSILQTHRVFAALDRDNLKGTWPPAAQRLVALHEGVCVSALEALDGWMMLLAYNAGFRYYVPWQEDMPERPTQLPSGAAAEPYLAGQIGAILYLISTGLDVEEAIGQVERKVAAAISTEPHTILRRGSRDRTVADMKSHGR